MAKASARSPRITKQPDEIPAVAELLKAEAELQEFIDNNKALYEQLRELIEMRNTKLEAAEKIVRAEGVTCGPFIKKSETTDINVEKLFDELGEDAFKTVGGYTETVTEYKIDRERFLSYLASGQIPDEVAEVCTKTKRSYTTPDPFKIP